MERLTYRDRKGHVYFDDEGSLIRGANGTFHQKKDMTGQFIHQRFVALDKAIDRLAAYEDTGLEPEEIMVLIAPPNPPLTLEDLREMGEEPVWVVVENTSGFDPLIMCALVEISEESVWLTNNLGGRSEYRFDEPIEDGITLYRHKPEEESR